MVVKVLQQEGILTTPRTAKIVILDSLYNYGIRYLT